MVAGSSPNTRCFLSCQCNAVLLECAGKHKVLQFVTEGISPKRSQYGSSSICGFAKYHFLKLNESKCLKKVLN